MEWLDDWLSHGWQVKHDYLILVCMSSPESVRRNPKTSRVGWCRSQLGFETTIGTAHLTRVELLRVPLASLLRIKEVRWWGDPVDYLQRHNFSRVTADQWWRRGRLGDWSCPKEAWSHQDCWARSKYTMLYNLLKPLNSKTLLAPQLNTIRDKHY